MEPRRGGAVFSAGYASMRRSGGGTTTPRWKAVCGKPMIAWQKTWAPDSQQESLRAVGPGSHIRSMKEPHAALEAAGC